MMGASVTIYYALYYAQGMLCINILKTQLDTGGEAIWNVLW